MRSAKPDLQQRQITGWNNDPAEDQELLGSASYHRGGFGGKSCNLRDAAGEEVQPPPPLPSPPPIPPLF